MAIFNSYLCLPEGIPPTNHNYVHPGPLDDASADAVALRKALAQQLGTRMNSGWRHGDGNMYS